MKKALRTYGIYTHYGITKGEDKEKRTECLFKAITAKMFPNLGKEMDVRRAEEYLKAQGIPNWLNLEKVTLKYYNQIVKSQRLSSLKQQEKSNKIYTREPCKTICEFFKRKFSGQEKWYDN